MKVLVIGSGAREHALAWRLSQEDSVDEVICVPGNGGTARCARNLRLPKNDAKGLVRMAKKEKVGLVVVGPEDPLVGGVVDAFAEAGIPTFGPSASAARLEGSKIFSKEFMARHNIPTAPFQVFDDADKAEAYVRAAARPLVVKADGLAAGKGVTVAQNAEEAAAAIDAIMRQRQFGDAGSRVLIEECLVGEEVSFHVISDGATHVAMAPAQDHKRALDGDQGPNTGGMGAYSPPPIFDSAMERRVLSTIVEPTLAGMAAEGSVFRGALFVGLMIVQGEPYVLEYNVRFGDPECECLLARWDGDLFSLLMGAANGDFGSQRKTSLDAPASVCVVLASGGYPGSYETGKAISGLSAAEDVDGVTVFHAGTAWNEGVLETAGGRVLAVTAVGGSIEEARDRAYRAADAIQFEGKHMRRDIGWRALSR